MYPGTEEQMGLSPFDPDVRWPFRQALCALLSDFQDMGALFPY